MTLPRSAEDEFGDQGGDGWESVRAAPRIAGAAPAVGSVWFLLRLVLAIVLAVADLLLSTIFLIAQVAYLLFGPTGRNVAWASPCYS